MLYFCFSFVVLENRVLYMKEEKSIRLAKEIADMLEDDCVRESARLCDAIDFDNDMLLELIDRLESKDRQNSNIEKIKCDNLEHKRDLLVAKLKICSKQRRVKRIKIASIAVAAAVIMGFIISSLINNNNRLSTDNVVAEINSKTVLVPIIVADNDKHEIATLGSAGVAQILSTNEKIAAKGTNNEKKANGVVQVLVPKSYTYDLTLPDGTTIKLNSRSELKYYKNNDTVRRVELRGEAYFKVAKSNIPFEVIANGSTIRVYGTEFNVNCKNNGVTETLLVEGSVGISTMGNEKKLIAGELATSEAKNNTITIKKVDTNNYIGWLDGKFIYTNKSLSDVILDINNWYGITIDTELDVLNTKVSFYARREQHVSEILSLIERVTNLTFINNGGGRYEIIKTK